MTFTQDFTTRKRYDFEDETVVGRPPLWLGSSRRTRAFRWLLVSSDDGCWVICRGTRMGVSWIAAAGYAMTRPRGEYGVDAPYVLVGLAAASVVAFALAGMLFAGSFPWTASLSLLVGVVLAASILSFAWTTRRGKFIVWSELLDALGLRGDEYLLDVGCGRGAVLMLAAKRLPHGRAVGLDLWSTADQSGNSEQATWRNADLEGVRTRVELRTGDMTNLPFCDESFDVVTSSLAIHNIAGARGREQVLSEMLRVLRRGGTLMIADIRHAGEYQRYFAAQPDTSVQGRRLGWRFWYGGPYAATTLVTVRRSG